MKAGLRGRQDNVVFKTRDSMINKSEANLVSFKILLTRDNKIVTEFICYQKKWLMKFSSRR